MRSSEEIVTWVVYEKQVPGKPKMTVVCEQPEWEALEQIQPNNCVLIRAGIVHEGEAEQLARSGAVPPRVTTAVAGKPIPTVALSGAKNSRATQATAMSNWWAKSRRVDAGSDAPSTANGKGQ
jgi:hypothetical protein